MVRAAAYEPYFISYPFNLENNWVLSFNTVLNQDSQDFEDF